MAISRYFPKTTWGPKDVGHTRNLNFSIFSLFYIYKNGSFKHYLFLRFLVSKKLTCPTPPVTLDKRSCGSSVLSSSRICVQYQPFYLQLHTHRIDTDVRACVLLYALCLGHHCWQNHNHHTQIQYQWLHIRVSLRGVFHQKTLHSVHK